MANQVSVHCEIAAPPEQVWAMVADVTRMGEWSPETEAATWLGTATGPKPGARFRGTNRNGKKKWTTVATIIEAEHGRLLSFSVMAKGFRVAEWRYSFEPTPAGCQVTETWTDRRGAIATALGKPVSGVADRAAHNRTGMERTLERIKTAAESSAPAD
jgi:uncharacterized protein YndB with AHSA1/START domain